jgi:hypothetical protein
MSKPFAQRWKISGFADPRNNRRHSNFNKDTGAIKVPYFDERYNLKSSFDSIRLNIENDKLHIDGYTSITNFRINHPKIAKRFVIKMPDLTIDYC